MLGRVSVISGLLKSRAKTHSGNVGGHFVIFKKDGFLRAVEKTFFPAKISREVGEGSEVGEVSQAGCSNGMTGQPTPRIQHLVIPSPTSLNFAAFARNSLGRFPILSLVWLPGIQPANHPACRNGDAGLRCAKPRFAANGMGKNALKVFGVGDGWPCADRNHASFLYRLDKVSILLDCGEPISRSYKASGLDYDLVDRVFLSHLHADHIGGFFMLMQSFWLEQRRKNLTVHMPADGIKPFMHLLKAGLIFQELLQFQLQFEPLKVGKAVATGDVRVTPYPSSHLEQLKRSFWKRYPQDYAAFSFLIEKGKLRIGHSADIGSPEDLEPLVKKPLDVLVCELSHFQPEDLFLFLQGRAIKKIYFMHLGRAYWENPKKIHKLAAKMMPDIPFAFLKDGQEVAL